MIKTAEMKTWYGLIATVGTLGSYSSMPGTLGSAAAFAALLLMRGVPVWLIAAVVIIGGYAADKYEKAAGREDPPEVVIDEVAGYWVSCWGFDLTYAVAGLFFFRIVDITKPFPIKYAEKLPGGVGIMADDILGGVMVNVLMRVIQWIFFRGGLDALRGCFPW
jgi:phosphatidylglycerophosphatase A